MSPISSCRESRNEAAAVRLCAPRLCYARRKTAREAIELWSATDGAKLLAGGQSLIPVMAYRLAAPPLLVDICDLKELTRITLSRSGVSLGSPGRWCDIE